MYAVSPGTTTKKIVSNIILKIKYLAKNINKLFRIKVHKCTAFFLNQNSVK